MDSRTVKDNAEVHDGVTRRTFLGAGAAGSAALLAGGFSSILEAAPGSAGRSLIWVEKTIPQLQTLMATRRLTSRELTQGYLQRIRDLNPLLGAVIETNPNAVAIAEHLDKERRAGVVRGPMHGIPVLLKDNIAVKDKTETTAGSLALERSKVPADATIVARLRAAGAVILGKANLAEWANFRGFHEGNMFNGWTGRGGFVRNPYLLSYDPCGSSSGSAVAAAANLCSVAVGSETDGSVVCPAGNNLIVGLKPTLGLVSQDGIIPIGHSQDTAGPMCRTVTDVAILLNVMRSPFGEVVGHALPPDYTAFLHSGAFVGKIIGVDERYLTPDYGGEDDLIAVFQQGVDMMQSLGATIMPIDSGDPFEYFDAEFLVLLTEFKVQVAQYLAGLRHTSIRTLADLIAFNVDHCAAEMKYFGQELFELAESTSGDLNDPDYLAARAFCLRKSRTEGIDLALFEVDAIVAPVYSFASSPPAVAGYPSISIPVGLTPEGKPAGIWMWAGFLQEPKLLSFAYSLEQALQPRREPQFLGAVPAEPPDAGLCPARPPKPRHAKGHIKMPHHLGTGKRFRR
jgi:amidase